MVAERFRRRDHAAINALWIGVQFQEAALLSILVPAIVLRMAPQTHTYALAVLSTLAGLAAALVPPFAGALSDHHRRGGGDRRIQTAVLLAVDAAALIGTALANSLSALAVALVAAVAAMNAAAAIYQVLVPEIVPRRAWGTAAGFRGAMTLAGTIAGLAVAALLLPERALFVTAGLIAISALTLFAVPSAGTEPAPAASVVRDRRDLGITLVGRAWIVLGMSMLNTYVLYFFHDVLGVHNASLGTGMVGGAALLGALVSSVWAGTFSDRVDRRVLVALSGLPMVAAAVGFALFPDVRYIFIYAALFGLGYGGVFAVGWALALDAIPEIGSVARDLGIWITLSNLPAVGAPLLGAAIIAHGASERDGFRWLFIAAGISFAMGSLTVLGVGRRPLGSPLGQFLLAVIALARLPYSATRMRIRQWGRLPFRRGPTILVVNHQHEDEGELIVLRTLVQGPWRAPVFTVNSRRMFEPGFLAERLPWTARLTHRLDIGPFFRTIGLNPIENQLSARPLASLAREVRRAHGDLALREVVRDEVLETLGSRPERLSDLERVAYFTAGRAVVKLGQLREPYRREALAELRAGVDADIAHIVALLQRGATFYVTPEGTYSTDGRMHPLRGIIDNLIGLGDLWLAAIAFDVFRGRRLSMLYRVVRFGAGAHAADEVATALAAARPITASALVAAAVARRPSGGSRNELIATALALREELPPRIFVDPEVDARPERALDEALAHLVARGAFDAGLARTGPLVDPRFPVVADMLAYQANFYDETLAAANRLKRVLART